MGEIILRHDHQEARIVTLGAALRSYRVAERDVVVPFPLDAPTPGMHGAVLAPWPNRLEDGRFSFAGVEYQVPITEPGRNNANHGLVAHCDWTVDEASATTAVLSLLIPSESGYAFSVRLRLRYQLTATGLSVHMDATNEGSVPAPLGIGFHPWLSPGPFRLDDCDFTLGANAWVKADERLLPVAVEPVSAELDFRQPRRLQQLCLDDGFADLVRDDAGRSWGHLRDPEGTVASIWASAPLRYWQVTTGDFPELGELERAGLAVEPMTCPANALATGTDVITVLPGQRVTVTWGLCLNQLR